MKNNPVQFSRALFCLLAVLFLYGKGAQAQTLVIVRNLDFGQFGMRDNNSPHTIVVTPGGGVTYDPAFIPDGVAQAHPGQYALSGLPPNMALNYGISTTNGTTNGGTTLTNTVSLSLNGALIGALFTVGSYTANSPSTDALGNATISIGGTLTTSGTGAGYGDGSYDGSVDLTIYF